MPNQPTTTAAPSAPPSSQAELFPLSEPTPSPSPSPSPSPTPSPSEAGSPSPSAAAAGSAPANPDPDDGAALPPLPPPAPPPLPEPTPELFGLTEVFPADPMAAFAAVLAADRPDALADQGTFALAARRAHRFTRLKVLKVHQSLPTPLTWEEFVNTYYSGGYDRWHRYQRAAAVQQQLHAWQMPLAPDEKHAGVLASHLKLKGFEAKLRKVLEAAGGYPSAAELKTRLDARPARRIDPWREATRYFKAILGLRLWDAERTDVLTRFHQDAAQQAAANGQKKKAKKNQPPAQKPTAAETHGDQ